MQYGYFWSLNDFWIPVWSLVIWPNTLDMMSYHYVLYRSKV